MMHDQKSKSTVGGARPFKLQYCPACRKYIFYPRELCPYCLEIKPEWKDAAGRGTVYSYTVVRWSALKSFEKRVPYIYALVDLEEGVRVPTNIVDCAISEVRIGMPVEVRWLREGDKDIPVFRPCTD